MNMYHFRCLNFGLERMSVFFQQRVFKSIVERKDVGVSRHLSAPVCCNPSYLIGRRHEPQFPVEDIITKNKTTYRLPSLNRMLKLFHCQRDESRSS